ncbi:ice-binding family protein [Pontibacter populi]|uniref:Ice-binding family protein n=1 Tax=Pontibacter populi TaxID=890055 RepID=A0ABV1RWE6_9BACT
MNKILLLICAILSVGITLSYGQTQDVLGNASSYAVLASTQINNTGQTGVTGNVGVSPGSTINGESGLVVKSGKVENNTPSAVNAAQDALVAYNALYARTPTTSIAGNLGESALPLGPGTYKISGDASFKGVLAVDGRGDVNSVFVFIIDGNLLTDAPAAGVLTMNGAQPSNIYWVVTGDVILGGSTGFQGTILAQGDITLDAGVVVIGRVLSLTGQVNLTSNNVFLPNVVVTDLAVTKEAAEGNYTVGSEVTYTITTTNNGPGTATDVQVKENIPAGLEFVRVEFASQGTYDETTHTWNVGTLVNTGTATLKLVFKVIASGNIKNGVTVIGKDPDPNPGDNTEEEPIDVPVPAANLSITKTASGAPYKVGGLVTYTIVASNSGPNAAENVVVTDILPAGLQYQSHEVTKGTYDPTTGIYAVGTLGKDESVTLTIVAKIVAAGNIVNVATITSPTLPDPTPGDNTDEEPIDVTCDAPTLTITGDGDVCEGEETTFTITEVIGATYTYTLPAGFTEVSRTATTITIKAGNTGGTLEVKVTDLCGNEYTVVKDVVVTPKPVVTISGPAQACANAKGLTYTVVGAGEGATYEWSVTGGITLTSEPGAATATINVGATGGTISVKVKNSCFESEPATTTITILPVPEKPTPIAGTSELCAGSTPTYEIAPVAGATGYTWTVPTGWEITEGQGTTKITVLAGATSGNVTVTADNECGSSEAATFTVAASDVPAAATITGTAGACIGTSLTYSVTPVDGATDYNWTVPQGWTIVSGNHTPTIEVTVGEQAGDVTVTISNSCGAGATATMAVAPTVKPATPTITGPSETCAASTGNVYSVTAVEGATNYTWTVPQGWTIESGDGTNSITVTAGETGGEVTLIVTNACGDSDAGVFAAGITTPPTSAGPITDNSSLCEGLTYSIAAVEGATDYTWTVPAGITIISGQGTTSIKVKADNANVTGDIRVVANTNGCSSPESVIALDMSLVSGDLNFPKAFSPNGDGINDAWKITNLEKYTGNEVMIFNRYGTEVYKQKNYQNDWTGKGLEQGTYFYKVIVKLCDGKDQVFTGYVTIFR